MMEEYETTGISGENISLDFVTAFRPAVIRTWTRSETSKWAAFLTSTGFGPEKHRRNPKVQSIIDLLY